MKTSYQANWEDEENNRQVELVVNYRLDQTRVDISDVTPTRVTFLCPQTNKQLRSVGVHTAAGRQLLARQVAAAGRLATLPQGNRRRPTGGNQASPESDSRRSSPRAAGVKWHGTPCRECTAHVCSHEPEAQALRAIFLPLPHGENQEHVARHGE